MTTHCSVADLSTWDLRGSASQRTRTPEGFMRAPAMISTADNVQPYRARELGLTDGDPDRIVRLFRPRSEVFSKDTLDSFEQATLTVSHPAKGVSARDWKRVTAGDVHEVRPVGDLTSSWLLIRDQAAIDVVEQEGTVQLSCGYDFDLEMTAGVSPRKEAYDGIQRNIRGNHVAIVDAARGGPSLRIADRDNNKETLMRTIKVADKKIGETLIPGFSFTVADGTEGQNVSDAYDRHMAGLNDCYMAHDAMTKSRDMEKSRADSAESKLSDMEAKKRASDEALDVATKKLAALPALIETAAAERGVVIADAATLVKDFAAAGKSVPAIRLEVLTAVLATDEDLKPIVTAALGGTALDKAPVELVASVFAGTAATAKKLRGVVEDASVNDVSIARDRALAGGGSEDEKSTAKKAGKAPRFLGMDAVTEANRLHRLGKVAEAEAVLEEARQ